jgi:serine/threonine protein kinase
MADKQGFLTKEGGSIKTWKKRWCVLKNGVLHYSKRQNSAQLGTIDLREAGEIKPSDARKKKNLFVIETPNRHYMVCAESEKDMQDWIKELKLSRDRVQGKIAASASTGPSSSSLAAATPQSSSTPTSSSAEPEEPKKVGIPDFELLKVIGKGSFGKVLQVRKKDTGKIYAMKVLNKQTIIARSEIAHTQAEKNILQKLVHPFLVNLNYSFQTKDKLYFIMDYVNGGELFFHLQKDKRFEEDRVRFYCAEIVCGLEYLHNSGVLYRDLKPENLLLTGDGHICMTDFGISKEGLVSDDARTATFCGTPEYLAPEVLEGSGYGKPVDWWSFGTLMYEMLTGLPPFYCQDVQQMYTQIMTAKLNIPENISPEASDLLQKLLVRDPSKRLTNPKEIKAHPFFRGIDWDKLVAKELTPPFIPPVKDAESTEMIDRAFIEEDPILSVCEDSAIPDSAQTSFDNFTYVAPSELSGH